MTYEWLLVQLRVLADGRGDYRSPFVAMAAQFERNVDDHEVADYVKTSVKRCRHNRNEERAA
jgi:hypothetical protein